MFELMILLATCLCALVAGFLLAFAVVVMPGIRVLDDRAFLRAFQVMDGVIQGHQPVFMVVWLGSALSLFSAAALRGGTNPQWIDCPPPAPRSKMR